jgi:[acyl-carrier-protein] S-malonyltransferase
MGKDIYDSFAEARSVFDAADKVLGFKLSRLCFEGPEEELRLTVNVQPAMLTLCMAILETLRANGAHFNAAFVAGHSLGEYTALAASGVLSIVDAVSLARERGRLMHQAGVKKPGSMAAVLGLSGDVVSQITAEAGVYVANYNCPGQIVISGEVKRIEKAIGLAVSRGAMKFVPLAVSGAFHTPMMQPAAEGLAKAICSMPFNTPAIPVVANDSALPLVSVDGIKDELEQQLTHAVQWQKSIEYMIAQDVDTFIEIGPGKVLSGLIKRISKGIKTLNIGDAQSINGILTEGLTL